MNRTSVGIRGLKPWGNPPQMESAPIGYQIDWDRTSDFFAAGKEIVKANGAASVGADALTVDALPRNFRKGERVDFGNVPTVVVTFGAAALNATTVPVTALSNAIPNGAILKTADSQEFVKLAAAAAAGATSLTTEAIPNALEGGETATFEGGENIVELTADALEGAVTIQITNLEYAIADNAEGVAQAKGFNSGDKFIPEATWMSLDATSKKMFPRRDANGVDEPIIGAIVSDATNSSLNRTDSRSGYGLVVSDAGHWENLSPDADASGDLPAGWKTEIQANTLGFTFRDYTDSRATA